MLWPVESNTHNNNNSSRGSLLKHQDDWRRRKEWKPSWTGSGSLAGQGLEAWTGRQGNTGRLKGLFGNFQTENTFDCHFLVNTRRSGRNETFCYQSSLIAFLSPSCRTPFGQHWFFF